MLCHSLFRQNSRKASEIASGLFGTSLFVTQTARSSDMVATGEGSNTLSREYNVGPDVFRNLKTNHGVLLDKTESIMKQIIFFRNDFINA